MKTYTPKAPEIQRRWFIVDADGLVLGRLATEIARVLRGKHKPMYTPHLDTGDYVVVVNAEKVRLTGDKAEQKTYFRHSGYMGGEQHIPVRTMLEKHPERVIELAQAEGVRGRRAPARGTAAAAAGDLTWRISTTGWAVGRRAWRASG
jgi:large subunit ribosomal protein L13